MVHSVQGRAVPPFAIPLFPEKQAGYASGAKDGAAKEGKDYSDKTVLAAAVEAGLLQFERRIPEILAGKGNQAGREEKEVSGENGDKGENRQDGSPVITVGGAKTQAPQIPQKARPTHRRPHPRM